MMTFLRRILFRRRIASLIREAGELQKAYREAVKKHRRRAHIQRRLIEITAQKLRIGI